MLASGSGISCFFSCGTHSIGGIPTSQPCEKQIDQLEHSVEVRMVLFVLSLYVSRRNTFFPSFLGTCPQSFAHCRAAGRQHLSQVMEVS